LLRHAIVVVLVVAFLGLGWWQLGRAEQGNALSFGYTIEWPFFATFVIFVWVREMRIALRGGVPPTPRRATRGGTDLAPADNAAAAGRTTGSSGVTPFDVDAALARRVDEQRAGVGVDDSSEYNQYLAWLAAHPDARPRDYPRPGQGPAGVAIGTEKTETAHG
jgi:hypothetical protein